MILMSVFESIKRECFPSPRGWVMGHCSVGCAGRDNRTPNYGDSNTRWKSFYTRFRRAVSLARGMPNTKKTKKWPD
jgi:hypothetical protein